MNTLEQNKILENVMGNEDEMRLHKLISDLVLLYRPRNKMSEDFYNAHNKQKNLDMSLPPQLFNLNITPAWAKIAVESLNDRINFEGFIGGETSSIQQISSECNLDLISNQAHRDALIYGVCYVMVGVGDINIGQTETVITAENPNNAVGYFSPKTQLCEAFIKIVDYEKYSLVSYILPDTTYTLKVTVKSNILSHDDVCLNNFWSYLRSDIKFTDYYRIDYVEVEEHNLGYVPVVRVVNEPRAGNMNGKSVISRNIRTFIEDGQRTYANMVSTRELHSVPRVHLLGADLKQFKQNGENVRTNSSINDTYTVVGTNPDGSIPKLEQLVAGSVEGYIEIIKAYCSQISASTGIPMNMLGYPNSNPASAEAINSSLEVLIKRAEDRTRSFSVAWLQTMRYSLKLRGETMPANVRPKWRNPRITSAGSAAQADAVYKLVEAGVLLPDSDIVYDMLGFDDARIQQLKIEKKAAKFGQVGALANSLIPEDGE